MNVDGRRRQSRRVRCFVVVVVHCGVRKAIPRYWGCLLLKPVRFDKTPLLLLGGLLSVRGGRGELRLVLLTGLLDVGELIDQLGEVWGEEAALEVLLIDEEADHDGVDASLEHRHEKGSDDEGGEEDADQGEETRLDFPAIVDSGHLHETVSNDHVATNDEHLNQEARDGGEGSKGTDAHDVLEEDDDGLEGGGAEAGVLDDGDHEGTLGDDLDETLNALKAAVEDVQEDLDGGVVLPLLEVLLLDVKDHGTDELDDGDQEGSEEDCTEVIAESDADGTAHGTYLGLLHATVLGISILVLVHLNSSSGEVPSADNGSHDEEGEHHHDVGNP